jgi:hypothetical protein
VVTGSSHGVGWISRVAGVAFIDLIVRLSRCCVGSGSIGIHRSLRDLLPLPAGPSRVFQRDHRVQPKLQLDGPHDLYLSFRALTQKRKSPLGDLSSHGIRWCALPPVHPSSIHSRGPRPPSVQRYQPPNLVPPTWFHTTMTGCSTRRPRVCCTPQPVKGSSRFLRPSPSATRRWLWKPLAFPATRFTPSEEFPSSAAVPHHCGRCLSAVTAHRSVYRPAEAGQFTVRFPPTRSRRVIRPPRGLFDLTRKRLAALLPKKLCGRPR